MLESRPKGVLVKLIKTGDCGDYRDSRHCGDLLGIYSYKFDLVILEILMNTFREIHFDKGRDISVHKKLSER